MHLDPVGSEETSSADLQDFAGDELSGREDDRPSPTAREGLPKRFRMRHGRHYVDELLGEAPLRTVREIPVSEIEPPPPEAVAGEGEGTVAVEILEESIRRLGVIEPLAVARRGAEYRVITGVRRLRAARTVGLSTVPCLVYDVDDRRLSDLREAAAVRPPAPEPTVPLPDQAAPPEPSVPADGRLRAIVLSDLARVESLRAKTASAAADVLARPSLALERASTSPAALIEEALAVVAKEARLRGIALEVERLPEDRRISIDPAQCRLAFAGLFQALIALSDGTDATLDVRAQVTTIRPALIVECQLRGGGFSIREAALQGFFDATWPEHPAGPEGAIMLAAVARIARAHGGRVQVQDGGIVTFVVPRPLTDI